MRPRLGWLALPLLLTGCGLPGNLVVVLPDDSGHVGTVSVSNASGEAELSRPLAAVSLQPDAPPGRPFLADEQPLSKVFRKTMAAMPPKPAEFEIYFEPGTTLVMPASRDELARAVAAARRQTAPQVGVVANTDPASLQSEDQQLMWNRARSIADALMAGGVDRSAIEIANYGPATPLVATQAGGADPRNTRVEVTVR